MVSEVIFPRFWGVVCIEKCFRNFEIVIGSAVSEISRFARFYVKKEFLRKILSLPDFEIRDSDDTQTIILENIIRSSGTFFISGGYLRTVVASLLAWFRYRALSWNVTTMGERHGFHSTQSSHIPQSAKLAVCSGPSWCMWG